MSETLHPAAAFVAAYVAAGAAWWPGDVYVFWAVLSGAYVTVEWGVHESNVPSSHLRPSRPFQNLQGTDCQTAAG